MTLAIPPHSLSVKIIFMDFIDISIRTGLFVLGIGMVFSALSSAVDTFVLPRGSANTITRFVFYSLRRLFELWLRRMPTFSERDRLMAIYAPVGLLLLLPTWLIIVLLGYMLMFWAAGNQSWEEAFRASGSSLLTLGYASAADLFHSILEFSEATIGLVLVALLIAYLPSMYSAFSRRESAVTLLEVRAGNPPSAIEMIARYHRIHGLGRLTEMWRSWEIWFAELEESHTSLAPLIFFRSQHPDHSWVTSSGAVLDAAALTLSSVDVAATPEAALCLRAGYLALGRIASFLNVSMPEDPHFPDCEISISADMFNKALDELAKQGVPLKPDRQQSWQDFAGWRVNYDAALLALADITMAPDSPWTGDGRAWNAALRPLRWGFGKKRRNS